MSLATDFENHCRAGKLIDATNPVLLAVSGGMDSMALAHLFFTSGRSFAVAHCNFSLRIPDADLDEALVCNWCDQRGISFYTTRFDTAAKAADWKKGIQETARILRYEWLENIRKEKGYGQIVTAHHADDNAETLLINIFRGCGIAGLHGIPAQNGYIVRPLLFAQRKTIEAYVGEHSVPYRTDLSNHGTDYLRNEIRHNVLPIVQQWLPEVVSNLNGNIKRFIEADILYRKAIEAERAKLLEKRGDDYYLPILKLRSRIPLETILYELLHPFGFSSAQVPEVIKLMKATGGHFVSSSNHRIIRNQNFLIITAQRPSLSGFIVIDSVPTEIETSTHIYSLTTKAGAHIFKGADVACFDSDKITLPLVLRRWKEGDYFYPFGMKMKKKKVSRLLSDGKVPLHEKEKIWVIESNKRIIWVTGLRSDERFKVNPNTASTLIIRQSPLK